MPRTSVRRPTHAGSWYTGSGPKLAEEIEEWWEAADVPTSTTARAIIGPHAGYSYCGHVMPYAYKQIDPKRFSRVFLLGPSHHEYTRKCLLSPATSYETPLGSMRVDQGVYEELKATGMFDYMSLPTDEAEHSLELHTPYIVKTMASQPFTLVPIMVGALTTDAEARYGEVLGRYLDDPANLFVVSSDFCHWGNRFSYTFHDKTKGAIWESIHWLDHEGMAAIESGDPKAFAAYLAETRNTICGRHPIGVFLNMTQNCNMKHTIKFVKYDQSSRCTAPSHSSVSYAAAVVNPV